LTSYRKDAGLVNNVGKDLKTEADVAAESVILGYLRSTGIPILSEEGGGDEGASFDGPMWIIDPLDGTFNFIRGIPCCCVSIAYWMAGQPKFGVIYDFNNDEMYTGIIESGFKINNDSVSVSSVDSISKAALATGFPSSRDFSDKALSAFLKQVQQFKKIRMLGSAAMSLAYIASGRMEAYYEEDIWLWDVAAGLALLRAAGGDYEITTPKKNWQVNVYAHNGQFPNLIQ
jgi:myo-inositol-1(or 4)-monophosphatase